MSGQDRIEHEMRRIEKMAHTAHTPACCTVLCCAVLCYAEGKRRARKFKNEQLNEVALFAPGVYINVWQDQVKIKDENAH